MNNIKVMNINHMKQQFLKFMNLLLKWDNKFTTIVQDFLWHNLAFYTQSQVFSN